MNRDRDRGAEGSLLFLTLLTLAAGSALVFLARTRVALPSDALNLNSARVEDLALTLEIDPDIAQILVSHRTRLGGFSYTRQPSGLNLFPDSAEKQRIATALRKPDLKVNKLGVPQLASALHLQTAVARRIVEYRDALPGRAFRSPDDILREPPVDDRVLAALGDRLIVRNPSRVFGLFLLYTGSLAFLAVLVTFVLRKWRPGGDPFLIPIALLLSGIGIITLFSLRDPLRDRPDYIHQAQGLWLGMLALLIGGLIPARPIGISWIPARSNLRRYTYIWAIAAIVLVLALWRLGHGPENVRLSLGFFQPVELVKILLVLFIAGYLTERGDLLADALHRWRPPSPRGLAARFKGIPIPRRQDFAPLAVMFAGALAVFFIVRDMGPALLLFGVFLAMLYMATGNSGIVWSGLALALIGGFLAYRIHLGVVPVRVEMWRAPWDNPYPQGMQLGQSLWAMASGGMFGTGLGLGMPATIPRGRDDLVFSAIGEELGMVGALVALILYGVLVARGLRSALRASNDFDRLLAAGLTAMIGIQTFLIVAGVTGLLPLTGITLPFISYGNSSLIADFFMLGILRAISSPSASVPVGAPNPLFRRTVGRFALACSIGIIGIVGIGRLFWIQAIRADEIAARLVRTPDADGVHRAKVNPRLLAMERGVVRGSIYDRNGKVLATSRLDEISHAFQEQIGKGDSRDAGALARQYYRRGRYYPRGAATAHLVGYLDPAIGGPVGIEKDLNKELRGFQSYEELVSQYRAKDLPWRSERRGSDVKLTIDADLQENTWRILRDAAGAQRDSRTGKPKQAAAMVILNPSSGELLASATTPSFNPNDLRLDAWRKLQENADGMFRLFDRSRAGIYPPGSTLKVATAAAGLEEGIDPLYDCSHFAKDLRWTYQGRVYSRKLLFDDKGDPPHDMIRMARALRVSCNLYYANLGITLGAERLHRQYADRFELRGVKPLSLFAVDLAQNAFGQGTMTASPMDMARISASVANGGLMMKPQMVKEILPPGQPSRPFMPALMGRPLGELNAKKLAEMMRGVVTDGTARGVFESLPVEVAGKTGTAQTNQGDGQPHSWFIGFTPYSRPAYAFACVIENGGYGKRGAAPAIRSVLQSIYGR